MFKHYPVRKKLLFSYLIVAFILLIEVIFALLGFRLMYNGDVEMYTNNTRPMADLAVMYDNLASQRICANNMAYFVESDPEFSAAETESLAEKEVLFEEALAEYSKAISNSDEQAIYDAINSLYYNDFSLVKENLRSAVESGDAAAMASAIRATDDMGSEISGHIDEAFELNSNLASTQFTNNEAVYQYGSLLLIALVIIGFVVAFIVARRLSLIICSPINRILAVEKQAGDTGDFNFTEETVSAIKEDATIGDELGQMAAAFSKMMDAIIEKIQALEKVAEGDLTADVSLASDTDTLGNAIVKMINNLNSMFSDINTASDQVATGVSQVATGAQSLAQASTEQATTVDGLSNSINDVAHKTGENTQRAVQAAELSTTIERNAKDGSQQMGRMIEAVQDINTSSNAISAVIKVIDDIAFQTNILALNAAVEAARAGEHGKGFAVVAEEVRNLAAKSQEAAKNTGSLIADSVEKAKLGDQIARDTSSALNEIVTGVQESTEIVNTIASASEEQNDAIANINMGIDQLTQVVQQNSATAQESAAASEEISSQSAMLKGLVAKFKLRG